MVAWIGMHPWMTFFIALAALGAVQAILSPPTTVVLPGAKSSSLTGALGRFAPRMPAGTGVYHGLVRRG